ncbi:MAG: acetyltransferase [Nitrosomonas sp.]|nr:acetyltransferase [Nitrosomonas sp.]MCW5607432.1 acetyltransferase [Nitrosomonas sp.]
MIPEVRHSLQNSLIEQCLPDGRKLYWQSGSEPYLTIDDGFELYFALTRDDGAQRIIVKPVRHAVTSGTSVLQGLLAALYCLFDDASGIRAVELDMSVYTDLAQILQQRGLAYPVQQYGRDGQAHHLECSRALLWQVPELWLSRQPPCYPLHYAVTNGKRHPLRPVAPRGILYQRYIRTLDKTISFRTIDDTTDLETFHRWMNTPRVAHFWEMQGSREEHARYIEDVLKDRHLHPLIGCFDGEPFGYFEAYWAKEDRIAPFYDVDDYDRGLHMLVGEERFRGPHFVSTWLPSLAHCLFLDDPRTRNVVAEPRADNAKMIAYMQAAGFHKIKEFDFPHKRAAMMVLPREVYFDQFCS